MLGFCRLFLSVCLILTACQLATPSAAAQSVKISQFSGKPVPRFASLRYGLVNGRIGPSTDHQVAFEYERAGMPVLIIKETTDWARVRDFEGDEVWIHVGQLRDGCDASHNQPRQLARPSNPVFLLNCIAVMSGGARSAQVTIRAGSTSHRSGVWTRTQLAYSCWFAWQGGLGQAHAL